MSGPVADLSFDSGLSCIGYCALLGKLCPGKGLKLARNFRAGPVALLSRCLGELPTKNGPVSPRRSRNAGPGDAKEECLGNLRVDRQANRLAAKFVIGVASWWRSIVTLTDFPSEGFWRSRCARVRKVVLAQIGKVVEKCQRDALKFVASSPGHPSVLDIVARASSLLSDRESTCLCAK
jgi:hypothetical protein